MTDFPTISRCPYHRVIIEPDTGCDMCVADAETAEEEQQMLACRCGACDDCARQPGIPWHGLGPLP